MDCTALSLSLSSCRLLRSAWASATVLDAFEALDGVHEVAAKGFMFFWPLMFTFRGRRELPEKVGNILGAGGAAAHNHTSEPVKSRKRRGVEVRV